MIKSVKFLYFKKGRCLQATLLLTLILSLPALGQQAGTQVSPGGRRIIFSIVEQPPEFPGGNKALQKYLADNVRYPEEAGKKFRNQTIFTNFIVTETGAIDSVRVLSPGNNVVDAEAIRVVENMPAWIPGKQSGHPVAVRYNIPVHFSKR